MNSCDSIHTWLDKTQSFVDSLTAIPISPEHVQVIDMKHRRSPSPELGPPQPSLTVPFPRKTFKQRILSMMSSDQTTLPDLYIVHPTLTSKWLTSLPWRILTPARNPSTSASSYQTPVTPPILPRTPPKTCRPAMSVTIRSSIGCPSMRKCSRSPK